MNHSTLTLVLGLLAAQGLGCQRDRPSAPATRPVQAGPNALGPDGRPRAGVPGTPARPARVGLAVGIVEGRIKPPDDKPNDDEDRHRVHPEWYPTGQPNNPYPAGTVIPIAPPPPGLSITPLPPMQPMGQPSMQPMGQPSMQPMGQPTMQPMGNNGVTMVPMGSPGVPPSTPSAVPMAGNGVTMVPMPAPGGQPSAPAPAPQGQPSAPNGTGAVAQTFQGTLDPSAERDPGGRFFRVHQVSLQRGSRVAITMQSPQFDTLLRVEPPTGDAVENDDVAREDTNSRVDFTAPIDGRYRIVATSYAPATAGAYTIQVSAGAPGQGLMVTGSNNNAPDAQTGPGGTIVPGTPVNEYLTPGDPSSGGRFVRTYRLDASQGDMVSLRLASTGFDPTIALIAPNGQRWSNDDTSPSDTNSTLAMTLPTAGSYRVEVSSYRPGATGPFSLTLSSSARPTVATNGAPVGSVAGRAGQGNMYGIFVGISDYGGRGNLYGCADDARQLAQAYINAHLGSAQNFVVLTDAEATTSAVSQAFQTMSSRVGANDVFMFFHSGHGSRAESHDAAADPDGYVESIVLRDGEISAHQMARLFDGVRADVDMLALDSCYSGGFERAFGASRNRFGMYSSEEDVLSQVAQRFQAGGYLSYFLRRGVSEADNNHDGAVRAGELADYLHRQYAQNLQQMQTQDGQEVDTWQHLVINRSGVALSDQLWRFPLVASAR
ncbi:MAG: pre-peptidase C-terminal domain-containing protein [Deltaproteobacteria bacterium]|nr:pre-peptidase C-terminal domain-containing protein [Deltaproteobacteria bacterium]